MDDDGFTSEKEFLHLVDGFVEFGMVFWHAVVGDGMAPELCGDFTGADGGEIVGRVFRDFFVGNEAEDVVDLGVADFIEVEIEGFVVSRHGREVEFSWDEEGG